jgi:hypothetical protein
MRRHAAAQHSAFNTRKDIKDQKMNCQIFVKKLSKKCQKNVKNI